MIRIDGVEIEVRSFYVPGCSDHWGARVWATVSGGPAYDVSAETVWSVHHRPTRDAQFPVHIAEARGFDDAVKLAAKIAEHYNTIDARSSS